jgi:hypothetical protein
MLTAITTVLLVLVVTGSVFLVVQALRGCLGASLWLMFGGLGNAAELVGLCLAAIVSGLSGGNN